MSTEAKSGRSVSLRTTLWLWMILVALVPLLIMAGQGLHCARQAVIELEHKHLQSILSERAVFVGHWLNERERDLRLSAFMSCGRPGCAGLPGHMDAAHIEAVGNQLNRSDADRPLYESLAIYDKDWTLQGRMRGVSHAAPESLLDDQLKARLGTADRLVVSASHPHADGHAGLHMAHPLFAADGRLAGAIVANVRMADTLDAILHDRIGPGNAANLYLVSTQGRYISLPEGHGGPLNAPAAVPPAMLEGELGRVHAYVAASGLRVLGVAAALPEIGWILVAEIDEAEALGWLAVLRTRALGTGILVLVVVIGLATHYAKKLTDPLRVLALTAQQITNGAYRERITGLQGREAREVAGAFNEMLDTLNDVQRKLVQSASLAAVGELSSRIVHEMRNPLSSVKMNLKALHAQVAKDPTYAELAAIASGQVERLETMLTDLLQYGKPLALNRESMEFDRLAATVVAALAPRAEAAEVSLSVQDDTAGQRFTADREQLQRALTNLVDNAIRVSQAAGHVAIRGSATGGGAAAQIQISVIDSGPGVSPSARERLFEPFFTTRRDGTGLGLANVRKIVELHGGTVDAANLPDAGARFTIRLPVGGYRQAQHD